MGEITLKLEVPTGLEDKVGFAVERVISEFLEEIQFSIARDILKESELNKIPVVSTPELKEELELGLV